MKKNLQNILPLLLLLLLAACTEHELFQDDEQVTLRYTVSLPQDAQTRAIGDGSAVDELIVEVFEGETSVLRKVYDNISVDKNISVELSLFKNKTYNIVFWAHCTQSGAYNLENLSSITVDYSKFTANNIEQQDAFCYVAPGIKGENVGGNITLTRPFAQLNVATAEQEDVEKVKTTVLQVTGVPTVLNPITKETTGSKDITFTFTDFATEELKTGESTYYYLATTYLLAGTVDLSVTLKDANGNELKSCSFSGLQLTANQRTNIIGDLVQQEEMEAWDGITFTNPKENKEDEYTCPVSLSDYTSTEILHINTPEELAYCMRNGYGDNIKAIHICADLDMGNHDWAKLGNDVGSVVPKSVPNGVLITGIDKEGTSSHTISNITINGNATTGLFGDAQEVSVSNLKLNNIQITSTDTTAVGTLLGTLKGNSSFNNVVIEASTVTATSAKVGGMVGYISRKSKKDRSETLTVNFINCKQTSVALSGQKAGKFVGELSGYDYQETLTFTDCTAGDDVTINYTSPYTEGNEGQWLAGNEYSQYNGFLGDETYCRGTVMYGENQFIPKWDGSRTVTPLVENSVTLIYSAPDLASLQSKGHTSVSFKQNVDLGSHKFTPIKSITNLDGEEHTLYNLKVDMVHDGTGAAFIGSASGTTTHKNLTLVGADVKNVHDTSLYPNYAITNDGGAGNAYGAIFISQANWCTSYTIDNIHVKDSKLYAVCKMGGVIGQSTYTKLYMSNCSVDNCVIQNYQPNVPNYYVLGNDSQPWMQMSSYYINLLQWWYTNGEVGGLIGFLKTYDADIDKCSVTNTQINCMGQPDKSVIANVYSSKNFKTTDPFNTSSKTTAKGLTTIAGRHVNQFIGDIVSERAEGGTNFTVAITNYTVSGNSYNGTSASSTNTYNHQYDKTGDSFGTNSNLYCEVVGSAYYVGLDLKVTFINLGHMRYCAGNVSFNSLDGKQSGSFTEAVGDGSNPAWTGGNFSIYRKSDTYPSEPARKDPVY